MEDSLSRIKIVVMNHSNTSLICLNAPQFDWMVSFKMKCMLSVEECKRYLPSSLLSFESKNGFRNFYKSALVKASRSHKKGENLQFLSCILTVAHKLFYYKSTQATKTRTFHYILRHLRNPGIPVMLEICTLGPDS